MASQVMRQLLKSAVNALNVLVCSYYNVMSYKIFSCLDLNCFCANVKVSITNLQILDWTKAKIVWYVNNVAIQIGLFKHQYSNGVCSYNHDRDAWHDTAQCKHIPCLSVQHSWISMYTVACLQVQRCVYSIPITYKSYIQPDVQTWTHRCMCLLTYIIMVVSLLSHPLHVDVRSPA